MKAIVIAATLFVIAATVYPAYQDGQRRFRWGEDQEVAELAARIDQFPKQIGDWVTVSDQELLASVSDILQPFTSISRTYKNTRNNSEVTVFILFGPTGPTAVHTPDICFNAREYRIRGERRSVPIGPGPAESRCFVTEFVSRSADRHVLKSWYAWTRDGIWQSPEDARYHFADGRYLVKVQVAAKYDNDRQMQEDRGVQEFMRDLEQTLQNKVF